MNPWNRLKLSLCCLCCSWLPWQAIHTRRYIKSRQQLFHKSNKIIFYNAPGSTISQADVLPDTATIRVMTREWWKQKGLWVGENLSPSASIMARKKTKQLGEAAMVSPGRLDIERRCLWRLWDARPDKVLDGYLMGAGEERPRLFDIVDTTCQRSIGFLSD